jgi:hypothetical protein
MIDAAKDALQEQSEMYEARLGVINHGIEAIKLLYGDTSYDALDRWYKTR